MYRAFKEEFKNMFLSGWRVLSYIVLLLIPLIYSVIVVSSFFKPFQHVDNLKIVVVNLDKNTKAINHSSNLVNSLLSRKDIEVGKHKLKIKIKDATSIYKTEAEVKEAVHNGDIAAAIVIPSGYTDSFSKMILPTAVGVVTNDPKKIADAIRQHIVPVRFHISFKHNFIRGEMTNLGAAIQKFSHDVMAPSPLANTAFAYLSGAFVHSAVQHHTLGGNIDTYGKGFSPLFISISLWAGAIASTFIIKNKRYGKEQGTFKTYFGKTLVWQLTSFIQSTFLTLGMGALGVLPNGGWADMWQLWLFFVFAAAIFSFIIQAIGSMFRYADIGKFIAVILLILNLVAASGSFPSFMQPAFFTFITDYLPFHYAIDGMREILWHPDGLIVLKNMLYLSMFPIFFIAIALISNVIFDQHSLRKNGKYDSYEVTTGDL